MSIDWTVVCDRCKKYCHLGQSMGGSGSFGYGKKDKDGIQIAADFIADHADYDNELRVVVDEDLDADYECVDS